MISKKWADLPTRFVSAVALLIVFAIALNAGSIGILIFGFVVVVAMQWELARMFGLSGQKLFALTAIAALGWLPMIVHPLILHAGLTLPSVTGFLPILIGAGLIKSQRRIYISYGAFLTFGMVSFWYLTLSFSSFGISILAGLVILSDVGGYLAGRMIGGVKLWPSISPKKTWSGTISGWILAAVFGFYLMQYFGDASMVAISVAVALGAQFGDIAESWVKRRVGVKNSSNLIPGHGGFLDRFDGFIGGAAMLGITSAMFLY